MTGPSKPADAPSPIEWHVAARPFPGEQASGDLHVVEPIADGSLLVAVVDGLGHGVSAAVSAETAAAVLKAGAHEPLESLLTRCHQELKGKRGAAITIASLNTLEETMTWVGIGNVAGVLLREGEGGEPELRHLATRGGVVGQRLGPLRPATVGLARDDTLVLATDGLESDFADGLVPGASPQQMAGDLLQRYGKASDDALVLVARYLGGAS